MPGYNFSVHVRRALQRAREEAQALDHEYVGTEHLLLGLIYFDDTSAAAILTKLQCPRDAIRASLLASLRRGKPDNRAGPDLPYTSAAKKILELSMTEAREMNHHGIGTEHLLLGALREGKGLASQALAAQGLALEAIRAEVALLPAQESNPAPRAPVIASFVVAVEDATGNGRSRRFATAREAIEFLNRFA